MSVESIELETRLEEDAIRRIVREELESHSQTDPGVNGINLIASKGTLDWAYPPLILSTTAAALGMEASIFFTFYGLNIIHKQHAKKLKISPVGNPAVPMPDIVTVLPGMQALATKMMNRQFKQKNVSTIDDLLGVAQEFGVKLIGCQMTLDSFGYKQSDFIDGVEFGGAAAFLSTARRSNISLFV
ncbi:MAG TPA: DsrE/DsrF/DrsH-like family protein [Actinomycetota bacterium]|nr:DsrE/DsrF/DrsH-like family protein [Actinomycetota bacterium]